MTDEEQRIQNHDAAEQLAGSILKALPIDRLPLLSLKACAYLTGTVAALCDHLLAQGSVRRPDESLGSDWLEATRSAIDTIYGSTTCKLRESGDL